MARKTKPLTDTEIKAANLKMPITSCMMVTGLLC